MRLGIFFCGIIHIYFGLSTVPISLANNITTDIPENVTIYALLNVHNPSDTVDCGKINKYGLQAAEAAFIAVNRINDNPNILPGVKLQLQIVDVCKSSKIVIKTALKIVYWRYMRSENKSNNTYAVDKDLNTILGVLGPYDHYEAVMHMQNLLQLVDIPQIANLALPPHWLKNHWSNSTTRKKSSQLRAIVDVIIKFEWTYISIIDDGVLYGDQEIQYLQDLMLKQGICVHKLEKLKSIVPSRLEFVNLVRNLNEKNNLTNVVLCLCSGQIASGLLTAVKTLKLTNSFTFITSQDWSLYEDDFVGLEKELEGSLSLVHYDSTVPEFDSHYCNLLNATDLSKQRRRWVEEIRQDLLEKKKKLENPEILSLCDKNYKKTHDIITVTRSVYALANTLKSMLHLKCGNADKICSNFWKISKQKFIMNLAHKLEAPKYTDSTYEILNYQTNFRAYKLVGTWDDKAINLTNSVIFREEKITSICSAPCLPGYFMIKMHGGPTEKCCWNCQPCPRNTIVSNDKLSCGKCPINYRANYNKTKCVPLLITYTFWDSPLGIATVILSVSGIITVFITVFLFIKNLKTPVVKSSSPAISFIMLAGIFSIFISAYGFVGEPTMQKCSLRRFLPPIGVFMIFLGLLIKTIRIVTLLGIKKTEFPKTKHKYLSTKFLLSIMACLFILRIIMLVLFYIYFPTEVKTRSLSDNLAERYCSAASTCAYTDIGISTILIILCTIYAIKGRNIPSSFNDTKYIVFAMYIIVINQCAFIVQVATGNTRIRGGGLSLMLNAWTNLAFLFFPKLYTIIFDPANNNSAVFLASLERISPFQRKPNESPLVKFLQSCMHFISPERAPSAGVIGIQVGERDIDDITFSETNDDSSKILSNETTGTNLDGDLVIQNPAYTRKIQNIENNANGDMPAEIPHNDEVSSVQTCK